LGRSHILRKLRAKPCPYKGSKGRCSLRIIRGIKPSLANIKVFGCDDFANVPSEKRKKLDPISAKKIFLGYDLRSKGYRLWDLIISRDVIFAENNFTAARSLQDATENANVEINITIGNDDVPASENEDEASESEEHHQNAEAPEPEGSETDVEEEDNVLEPQGRPVRTRKAPKMFEDFAVDQAYDDATEEAMAMAAFSEGEPKSYRQTIGGPDADKWREAMHNEYKSLCDNQVFTVVQLPKGREAIDSRWVFKMKRNANGDIRPD
jgi:hypothetical protein